MKSKNIDKNIGQNNIMKSIIDFHDVTFTNTLF